MQIAGIPCGVCGSKILVEGEGRGCPRCRGVYHARCLPAAGKCPQCKTNLELETALAEEQEERDQETHLERGRTIVLAAIAFFLLGPTLGLIRSIGVGLRAPSESDLSSLLEPLVVFLLALALSAALYWGSHGTRVFLRVIFALGAVLQGLGAWKSASDGPASEAIARALTCLALVLLLWVLTSSKSADHFLRRSLFESAQK